jgi:hypothetical protein
MGKLRSSAIFYRRGVPDSAFLFGIAVQRNYTVASVSTEYKYNLGLPIYSNRFPRPMLRTSR